METINITEAKSRFSEYLARAARGERFIIMHRARPLAVLTGVGALERLERSSEIMRRLAQSLGQSPKLLAKIEAGKVHPAMAAFGLWQDEEALVISRMFRLLSAWVPLWLLWRLTQAIYLCTCHGNEVSKTDIWSLAR